MNDAYADRLTEKPNPNQCHKTTHLAEATIFRVNVAMEAQR